MVSLVGSVIPKCFVRKHNRKLIAFCIGSLTCTLFYELLPHSLDLAFDFIEKGHAQDDSIHMFSWLIFSGILLAFFLETLVHFTSGGHSHGHRGCGDDCEETPGGSTEASRILKSRISAKRENEKVKKRTKFAYFMRNIPAIVAIDVCAKLLHHLVDGIIIGSLFSISLTSGVGGAISVAAHEISANLGAYSIYVASGMNKRGSILACVVGATTIVPGGILFVFLGTKFSDSVAIPAIIFIANGLFIYLLLADLLPLLIHAEHGTHGKEMQVTKNNVVEKTLWQKFIEGSVLFFCFAVGFIIIFLILHFMGHDHK
ncbi:hypothetical protein MHBO_002551 [Bonamia ostreae]|uniref:Uncharacterized protein n=1 Tax=Bonamia ostreae TaxID=126728 RepID=A0ABV2AN67_9EUKA